MSPERPQATGPAPGRGSRKPLTKSRAEAEKGGRAAGRISLTGAWAVSTRGGQPKSCPSAAARPSSAPAEHPPGLQHAEALACPLPPARGKRGAQQPRSPSQVLRACGLGEIHPKLFRGRGVQFLAAGSVKLVALK